MNKLWQKTTALHDRIDIRLFDEEWDKRRVKHEKKVEIPEDYPTTLERWLAHQMRGSNQEALLQYQLVARFQEQQQQHQSRLGSGLSGATARMFAGYAMQKCPYCGR